MTADPSALAHFSGQTRLFPLPNLVLFPHVIQGLHIFEPRYRQMMVDSLASDRLMTIVLLKPGWEEDLSDRPGIEAVGCLGQIGWHERLPDGRFNLRLHGLTRVRILEELPTDRLYRLAKVATVSDIIPDNLTRLTQLRRRLAEAVLARFPSSGQAYHHLQELFDGDMPLGQICDVLAYALPLSLELKQALLAEPMVDSRAEMLAQALALPPDHTERKFPPEFSLN